ncbi:hypothetical protein EI94DRAFT_1705980 [Lactarius quietus]|nr:hypothetical protein EI94DRAFT_1705980 [Lactarius quietus]
MASPTASGGQPLVLAALEVVNLDLTPVCWAEEEEHTGRAGEAGGLCPPPPPSLSEDHQATPSYHFCRVAVGWSSLIWHQFVRLGKRNAQTGRECPIGLALLNYWLEDSVLLLHRHPLRTIRPPPPTAFVELQWGEPRLGVFWHLRMASLGRIQSQCCRSYCPLGATVVNPDLAPVCQVGEEERAGRMGASWPWERCSEGSPPLGLALLNYYLEAMEALTLLRRPLRIIRLFPPTIDVGLAKTKAGQATYPHWYNATCGHSVTSLQKEVNWHKVARNCDAQVTTRSRLALVNRTVVFGTDLDM